MPEPLHRSTRRTPDLGPDRWWYASGENGFGPFNLAALKVLLADGSIGEGTFVRREGMSDWKPLSEVEELAALLPPSPMDPVQARTSASESAPEGAPAALPPAMAGGARASLAQRAIARLFNLQFYGGLALILTLATSSDTSKTVPATLILAVSIGLPLAALILEAVSGSLFGNSFGKELVGITTVRVDGSPLSFGDRLYRVLDLWLRGLGLSFGALALITASVQVARMSRGQPASWDEGHYCVMQRRDASPLREAIVTVMCALLMLPLSWVIGALLQRMA